MKIKTDKNEVRTNFVVSESESLPPPCEEDLPPPIDDTYDVPPPHPAMLNQGYDTDPSAVPVLYQGINCEFFLLFALLTMILCGTEGDFRVI